MKKALFYLVFFFLLLPLCGQRRWTAAGVPVSLDFSFAENQLLASDGAGGAIVAWMDMGRRGYGLYAQRLNARGTRLWGDRGIVVKVGSPVGQNYVMTADGKGGVILAWEEARFGNSDIFAQRINAAGNKLWGAKGSAVCLEVSGQISPRLAADGSGGAIFAWHDFRLASSSDIFAQRLDALGRRSWAVDGIAVCTAANVDTLGAMISDGSGGAILVWGDYRLGSDQNIFAQRVDGAGQMLWPVDGTAVCSAPEVQGFPKAVVDGAHGAIIAWSDVRNGRAEIYAQRVDPTGNGLWQADGIPVSTRGNYQYEAAIAEDGKGGAVIAWIQGLSPSDSYHDVFAQHLDAAGDPLWAEAGVPVCEAAGDQTAPQLTADKAGGAIVIWTDGRVPGSIFKIYASHLDDSGAPQWGATGMEVSLNNDSQYQGRLVPDGKGGAIAIYRDYGNMIQAIHAQRLSPFYTVSFSAGEGGRIAGNLSQKVYSGTNCSLVEAMPKTGYRFRYWSGTGGYYATDNPLRVKKVTEDLIIQANFAKRSAGLDHKSE